MTKIALLFTLTTFALAAACSSSGGGAGGDGATSSSTSSTSSTSAGAGTGGSDGACKKCGTMLSSGDTKPSDVCSGNSRTLYSAVTTCVCQPTVCGSAEAGADNCAAECTTPGTAVSAGCQACDEANGLTACATELAACNADM